MSSGVNNEVYHGLGERWYTASDDPIALLRAEARARNPWIAELLRTQTASGGGKLDVLDIGCGAGFLSNYLAQAGHRVSGLDASEASLEVARTHDSSRQVDYRVGDALALPFASSSFDSVCAMDFLEHVENPRAVVAEAARVLRSGGLFFFHTFDRSWISWLLVIKAVEWFVRNTPRDLHVLQNFVRPAELAGYCANAGLEVAEMRGLEPRIFARSTLGLVRTGVVPEDFSFQFTNSLKTGYIGWARKAAIDGK